MRSSVFNDFLLKYRKSGSRAFYLMSLFSKGDTYLIASVAQELFEAHKAAGFQVIVFIRQSHMEIAELFESRRVRFVTIPDDEANSIRNAANDAGYCQNLAPETLILVHPSFMGSRSTDQLTFNGALSQLDMYRHLLGLPMTVGFDRGTIPESWRKKGRDYAESLGASPCNGVLLLPSSNSWPEIEATFWEELTRNFKKDGIAVYTNSVMNNVNEVRDDLGQGIQIICDIPTLFGFAEYIGWVVGTLTGVLNIMISTEISAAKTLLAKGADAGSMIEFGPTVSFKSAFPYAFQRTYDGCDYDIEELEVTPSKIQNVIDDIVNSWNRYRPSLLGNRRISVSAPTGFGDIVDRISILEVKKKKIADPQVRYKCNQELTRLWGALNVHEITDLIISNELDELLRINEEAFDVNEVIYSTFGESEIGHETWTIDATDSIKLQMLQEAAKAFRKSQALNRRRVGWKRRIDEKLGSVVSESKSFSVDIGSN